MVAIERLGLMPDGGTNQPGLMRVPHFIPAQECPSSTRINPRDPTVMPLPVESSRPPASIPAYAGKTTARNVTRKMRIFINMLIRVSHDVLLEEDNVNFGLVIKSNYLLQSYIISPTMG